MSRRSKLLVHFFDFIQLQDDIEGDSRFLFRVKGRYRVRSPTPISTSTALA